ncbi:MAG: XrtB/PEP-CTERM-associated transcriptional regulator EpsA [Gallionella sp.]
MFKDSLNDEAKISAGRLAGTHVNGPATADNNSLRQSAFFEAINTSLDIDSPDQLCAWMQRDLQQIFPHGMMVCAIGEIEHLGSRVRQIISSNFPLEYVKSLQQVGGLISSPLLIQWLNTRRPVLFEIPIEKSERNANRAWLEMFKRFELRNVAAHGLCDIQSNTTSYFSFSQIPGKLTEHHAKMLEMLVPHLHVALIRAINGSHNEPAKIKQTVSDLTPREQQVLQWLCSGKTNWEIAQILYTSESTIKKHVQRILGKLKANSRVQAVAFAVARGLEKK